jgi:hypothetical protein
MLLQVELLQATALCSSSSRSSSLQWLQEQNLRVQHSSLPQLQLQQPSLTVALQPGPQLQRRQWTFPLLKLLPTLQLNSQAQQLQERELAAVQQLAAPSH